MSAIARFQRQLDFGGLHTEHAKQSLMFDVDHVGPGVATTLVSLASAPATSAAHADANQPPRTRLRIRMLARMRESILPPQSTMPTFANKAMPMLQQRRHAGGAGAR